ncbi:unnamed protein product [Cylindrotheca closterium]|uniref:Major facilitator superfamily (MFS) profile domain-containing protein n=1 Tax=Cylindrotheca closterium TaxID=2856 RepID=A0AAD2CP34_9STRA|nr:unnamed protein product [Cylindrotheca closterium]
MTEDKSAPAPKSYVARVLLVIFAMVQITLAAGLIIGWPGIAGSMLVEPLENGGAGLTLDQTTQLYGLAAAVNYVAPLFLGLVLDKFGPRACSVLSNAIVSIGLAIFSSASSFSTFALGICCVAFGGPSVQQCLLHIGNIFAERRYFVMGIVAESITLSFAIFPVMDIIWEHGYGFRILFAGLGVLVFLSTIGSLLLWPDAPYEIPKSDDANEEKEKGDDDPDKDLKEASFFDQLSSGVYLRLCIFFVVTSWWGNFYIATVTVELGDQGIFDAEMQHTLTRWLSFLDAGAIIAAPLSGYMLDSVGFAPTAVVTIALGILQQVGLLVAGSSSHVMIGSFTAYAVYRAFLFPYFFASLSRRMGFRFFGFLSGISFCISGFTQFGVAPVALVIEGDCHKIEDYTTGQDVNCSEGSWVTAHWLQIIILALLLLVPFLNVRLEQPKRIQNPEEESTSFLPSSSSEYGSIKSGP